MNKQDQPTQPADHPAEDAVEREIDEPLIVDEEEAEETEQIKAELREREGKL